MTCWACNKVATLIFEGVHFCSLTCKMRYVYWSLQRYCTNCGGHHV